MSIYREMLKSFATKLRECLVGVNTWMMKNKKRKIGLKMTFFTVWFKKENKEDKK